MPSKKFQPVKGMRDLVYEEAEKLVHIIKVAREVSYKHGYREVILPTIEYYSLFAEKSGYEISKRMYVFEDLSGRKLALRPELTPSIARLYINSLQTMPKPVRLSYFSNVFRYDEPQRARYREFWQAGFEHLGSSSILADLEVILLAFDIFDHLELKNVKIKLGSMELIKKILLDAGIDYKDLPYFLFLIDKKKFEELSKELKKYDKGTEAYELISEISKIKATPLEMISEAKKIINKENYLEPLENLGTLIKLLKRAGLTNIELDLSFARGIEYYTGIIYEFEHEEIDVAIGGGGRYDLLIEYYGGPKVPATGCALGLDRIALIYKGEIKRNMKSLTIFLLEHDEDIIEAALSLSHKLRKQNIIVVIDTSSKNLSTSLSAASKLGYDYFLIMGGKEFKEGKVILRDLKKRIQQEVSFEKIQELFS